MEVNDALIDNLSNLARLEFNAVEKEAIKHDLQRMIRFVEKLGELDTAGVESTSSEFNDLRILFCQDPAGNRWELRGTLANA